MLLAVMAVGVIGKNHLLVRASGILLFVLLLGISPVLEFLERDGLEVGILVLTIAVLTPLATGETGIRDLSATFTSHKGVSALIAGALAAWLTAQGVGLLRAQPEIVLGLAIGTIFGAAFLGGIPAGPLVAAGFAAVLIKVLGKI